MLIDSHAHVDGPEFDADRAEVLARARAAGVQRIVVIGAVGTPDSAERAVALAERDPEIWATVATHPHDAAQMTPAWWEIHDRLARHPRVVAVGETGLDYYYDHSPRDVQQAAFARFIELARAVGKPVVCHIRDAHDDARAILRAGQVTDCVIHCFTGTPDDARAYAELGYYVSFSGIVTYKTAQALRDAVPVVPRDRLLIETDCPYLAPVPRRGKRNEPAFLTHTAEVVAQYSGMSFEDLAEITARNACRVFHLPAA
ncbi:MAG TPA: TatD family hydrolase [Kofleriaceae bacterium]|jgi:TatD DNase family protein|nr:TatD family hydrolase [Kofleriaceae bacterium]